MMRLGKFDCRVPDEEAVETLDVLVVRFLPVTLLGLVASYVANRQSGQLWVFAVVAAGAGLASLVAAAGRRIPAALRLILYSLGVGGPGLVLLLERGLWSNGMPLLMIAMMPVTLGSRCLRYFGHAAFGAGLLAVAMVHLTHVIEVPAAVVAMQNEPVRWVTGVVAFLMLGLWLELWRQMGNRHLAVRRQQAESIERTEHLLAETKDPALQLKNGLIVAANRTALETFGLSAAALRHCTLPSLGPLVQPPTSDQFGLEWHLRSALEGQSSSCHWTFRRADHSLFEAQVRIFLSQTRAGQVLAVVLSDISAQRRIERDRAHLAVAVDQAGEAVMITDRAGTIQYVNAAFERITGYSREEARGRTPKLIKSGEHDVEFYRGMWSTLLAGHPWQGRLRNRRKDGSLYMEESTITPVRDTAGTITHFVSVKRDISRELQLEQQLSQAQKMEAVGRLAGGVAHDFNNLLHVMVGNLTLAELELPPAHPARELLGEIARAGERAMGLVRQLLAFSRKGEVRLQQLNLNDLLAETVRMLRRLIGEDIVLQLTTSPQAAWVNADAGQLEQVLINLCVNARDAMPEGGRLTIEVEPADLDADYCALHPESRPGRYVVMAVSDTGTGIPPEVRGKIFEPFFTTKEVGKGTGLGLATVYAIIQRHGGFINVYSEVGQGTTFRAYLPLIDTPAGDTATPVPPPLTSLKGAGETILLVEDDELVLKTSKAMLEAGGYRVLAARDGLEALEVHDACGAKIAAVIVDVVMPRLNGRQVYDVLHSRDPRLPILFATGYSQHHLADGFIDSELVLRKPFTPQEVLTRLRAMLAAPRN